MGQPSDAYREALPRKANSCRSLPLQYERSGITCDIPPELTVLEVADKNGIFIPYSCRQGQCGTCVTRLAGGAVRMESELGLSDELKAQGYILPCVSRGRGNIKLEA